MRIEVNASNIKDVLTGSYDKPLVLIFHSDWCPACEEMITVYDGLFDEYNNTITFGFVNVDKNNDELNREFSVDFLPTTLFIADGEVLNFFDKKPEKDEFVNELDSLIEKD